LPYALIVGCVLFPVQIVRAQGASAPRDHPAGSSTAAEVGESLRARGNPRFALRTLRQEGSSFPRRDLDAIADTLVDFIIRSVVADTNAVAVGEARLALGLYGVPSGGGTPYKGAGARLLRVIERTPPAYSAGEFYFLGQLADRAESVRLLAHLARSDSEKSVKAIGILLRDLGPDGEEAVRRIYFADEALNESARQVLRSVATLREWGPPEPKRPLDGGEL
jgi:hypothetical protein